MPTEEAVQLSVRPEGFRATLRYWGFGRPLLARWAQRLRRLPEPVGAAARQQAQQAASRALLRHLQVHLMTRGSEHLHGGPFVVVALHESLMDVPALLTLPLPMRVVARDEIFGWPLIGPAVTRLGHLSISPERGAAAYRQLLRAGAGILAGGESLVLFPQGSVLGIETDFQRGAFRLAARLGAPLLPVVITGGHRIWEHPYSPVLRYRQPMGLRVLPPIGAGEVQSSSPDLLADRVQRLMKRAALAGDLPAPRRYEPERDGYWDGYRFEIDPAFPDLAERVARHRAARFMSEAC